MSIRIRTIIMILIVLGAVFLYGRYYLTHYGISARAKPSRIEEFLARNLRDLAIPASARDLKNPISLTPENFPEASGHWMEHCATCHAPDGGGDTVIGRNIYPKAPDMKSSAVQDLTDGEIFYIISNGVRLTAMPAWGDEDSPDDIWKLVAFIRRLPKLTPQEIDEMKEAAEHEHEADQVADPSRAEHGQASPHQHEHKH